MAKYGSGLSTEQVCKLECEEAKRELSKRGVPEHVIENITGMIEQAYYMLSESYKMAKMLEAFIDDKLGVEARAEFLSMITTGAAEPGPSLMDIMRKDYEEREKRARFERIK